MDVLDHAGSRSWQLRIAIFCQQDVLSVSVLRWLTIANVTATRESILGRLPGEPAPDAVVVFADDYPTRDVISTIRPVLGNTGIRRIVLATGTPRNLDLLVRCEGARDRLVILPQPASGMELLDLVFAIAARLTVEACRDVTASSPNGES